MTTWTLGIDTATDVRVGLARDGEAVARAAVTDRMQHAEQLLPLIRGLLAGAGIRPADLDLIAVGLGPGPFTGLRVGIATARMLATVTGADLHGVCSLDVLAWQIVSSGTELPAGGFLVATDARRREVYWARYDATGHRITGPAVGRPADVSDLSGSIGPSGSTGSTDSTDSTDGPGSTDVPVVGPATLVYPELPALAGGPGELDAGALAAAGRTIPSAGTEPLYLRRPDATLPGALKSVLATAERSRP